MIHFRNAFIRSLVILAGCSFASGIVGGEPTFSGPDAGTKAPTEDGFLQRWIILEPIRSSGLTDSAVQAAVKREDLAELLSVIPKDGDAADIGNTKLEWHAVDTKHYNVNLFHFARHFGKPTSNVLFWAVTIVDSPEAMHDVRLAIGSNAASVWWVNGKEVIGIYNDRQTVIDDGVSKRISLNKGHNIVRGAIINGGGATDFCARFLNADDQPITKLTIDLRHNAPAGN